MLSRLPTSSKAVAALLLPRLARSGEIIACAAGTLGWSGEGALARPTTPAVSLAAPPTLRHCRNAPAGAPSAAAPRGAPFLSTTPPPPARRLHAPSAAAADSGTWSDGAPRGSDAGSASRQPPAGFASLERMLTAQLAGGAGGPGGNWREVADCFVLYPPEGAAPRCLVHFIGGSFVGAAPQLAYGPLLEALAARGTLVRAPRDQGGWLGLGWPPVGRPAVGWSARPSGERRWHLQGAAVQVVACLLDRPLPFPPPFAAGRGGALRHLLRPHACG